MMKNYIRKDRMILEGIRYRGVHIELTKKDAFVECMKALYDDLNNKGDFVIRVSTTEKLDETFPASCELETMVQIQSVE